MKKRMKSILLLLAFVCVMAIVFFVLYKGAPETEQVNYDVEKITLDLEQAEGALFGAIRDNLPVLIDEYGIVGVLDISEQAFINNKIGIYQCHVLMHTIGHEAVGYYNYDYEKVLAYNSGLCELGYRHGAEAQVILTGGQYIDEIEKFCTILQTTDPDAGCFHGAGHAFMNETLDVYKALDLCETLSVTGRSVDHCYNAVFAELTNLVGGKDGATGVDYTSGPAIILDADSPIEYCSEFAEKHRYQCVFEFSGLGISEYSEPSDIEERLKQCTNGEHDAELESGCIKSVSAVGAQHELAISQTITFPEHILDLPDELRQAYILGAGSEMNQYIISGAERDWKSFCLNFTQESDVELCNTIFNG